MATRVGVLVALLSVCPGLYGQEYPDPPFLPPAGHPRVYFRANDVPRILENAKKPQNARAWQTHLRNLAKETDGVLPQPASAGRSNADSAVLAIIESGAFDHATRKDEQNGRKAIRAMRNYVRTISYAGADYNVAGQTVFTIAIVYDWCHPLLTADDRSAFYDAMTAAAAHLEVGWPPVKQGNVVGHGPEGQIFRDLMSAAIAMYDEYPDVYRMVAGRFFSRMVEAKKFMYQAHMHSQGSHYVTYRGQWEMLATWLFDRIGLPQVFGPDQRYFMYWTLYARRPDGQVLRDGDTHINNIPFGTYYTGPARTLFLAANYFHDPYLKNEALKEIPDLAPGPPRGNQSVSPVEILVFNDPDLEPAPMADLPLTKYFPYPKGAMIARTGWDTGLKSASVVAEMKINEWFFANHQHLDAGAFQIYYRGALATDSGYYQAAVNNVASAANDGSSGYGSAHDLNYNKRSIAHNTILVYDPAERFEGTRSKEYRPANDGGQRQPNHRAEPRDYSDLLDPANGYRIGRVLGHGFGPNAKDPDYTYLEGDLKNAYSAKVKACERSFVFLNLRQKDHPAALVVFDRVVSTNPDFRKAWLLHGLERPEISANRTVFKDTRPGCTGKLTVDTVLPEPSDTEITSIGGPGKEAWVDGVNFQALTRPNGSNEGGGWRIEVSPKAHRESDLFLHVLQVGDHTPDVAAFPVERIDTETHAGVNVAGRVVLLGKAGVRSGSAVSFQVTAMGKTPVLIADLKAGVWRLQRDGKAAGTVTVADGEGTAWFAAGPGAWRLEMAIP